MVERLLKKAAFLVLGYYKLIVCLFAFLTILSVYTVFHMEIKTDLIDVMPRDNPTVDQFKDFVQKYNVLESVMIIISSTTNGVDEHADLIEALAEKLKQSSLVEQVDYTSFGKKNRFFLRNFPLFLDETGINQLFKRLSPSGIEQQIRLNYQKLVSPVSSPTEVELIDRDPLNLREIIVASMKRSGSGNPFDLSLGYYITKDHSTALIFVKPKGRSKDMAFARKLKPALDAIIRSTLTESGFPSGISVQLTGGYIFSDEIRQVIKHDIISSILLSSILISLIIWLGYRVRAVVLGIVACTTLASLSMTLAVAYLIFGSLNIVTSIVCGLLIGMYVDYCILTLKRYGDELLLRRNRQSALEITITKAGMAMLMSAITTSLSFFSIIITRFDGLHELGIVCGIGVLICFFVTLFFMSSLLFWTSAGGADRILSLRKPTSGVEGLVIFIEKYPRRIVYIGIPLVMLLVFGMKNLRFDMDPEHIGIKNSPAMIAMRSLNLKLRASGEPLQVIIKKKNIDELNAAFERLVRRLALWKSEGLIGQADSLSGFIPPPHIQNNAMRTMETLSRLQPVSTETMEPIIIRELNKYEMAYDHDWLTTYLASISDALHRRALVGLDDLDGIGDHRINRFFNKQDKSIVAYLYSGTARWDKQTVEALQKKVSEEGRGWTLLGSPVLYAEIKSSILWGSSLAAAITLGLNIALIVLFLKNNRYVVLAMLPVCIGFVLTLAIMGWLDSPFNFINIGAMALIFGFGVDYGIYILQAYLREGTRDINNALRLSGKNVIMCAATTIAGCGSLATASFPGIALIGLVLTIGAICCSAITIILLPALLWLKERQVARGNI